MLQEQGLILQWLRDFRRELQHCTPLPLMWSMKCNQECYYLCCNCYYFIQQIRASDIWRESEHEDLQHRLLDYHIKVTMRGTRFDPPTIKFEGSTDDSQLDVHMKFHRTACPHAYQSESANYAQTHIIL